MALSCCLSPFRPPPLRLCFVVTWGSPNGPENRAGPSNLGNVISQILLCKQITPDFNEEELCSIMKDTQEIAKLINDMQEFMPQQELHLDKGILGVALVRVVS